MKIRKIFTALILTLTAAMLFCSCGDKAAKENIDTSDPSKCITINGKLISIPCSAEDMKNLCFTYKVYEDFPEQASIYKNGIQIEGTEICILSVREGNIDLSEPTANIYVIGDDCRFDYMGITEKSTREQAREILGEPVKVLDNVDIFNYGEYSVWVYYGSPDISYKKNLLHIFDRPFTRGEDKTDKTQQAETENNETPKDPLSYMTVNGKEIPVPCSAEDMKNAGFTYKITDDFKELASVYADDAQTEGTEICILSSAEDEITPDKPASFIGLYGDKCSFDYMGITENTTKEQARELLGEPEESDGFDDNSDTFDLENCSLTVHYGDGTKTSVFIAVWLV